MPHSSSVTLPVGRFAPSPTGPVHPGTLAAAMASYLDVKVDQGKWLLRIDDIDKPREIAGSATQLQQFLDKAGFAWDGPVSYQSDTLEAYQEYLQKLQQLALTYRCICSRKQLTDSVYPGTCRQLNQATTQAHAVRLLTSKQPIHFMDRIQGKYSQQLDTAVGDFVIFRKDGLFAYQFAVVIDDQISGINRVTRGMDLLESTPRQIYLQQCLGFTTPSYAHLPLLFDSDGNKFSKSSLRNKLVEPDRQALVQAWNHLQSINVSPADFATIDSFWDWATENWHTEAMKDKKTT